jgi:ABC-type phosphate/phosphonate transport system substrate-binding protein
MPTIRVVRRSVIAVAAVAALGLTGCSGTQEAAKQAGDAATNAATATATATGQAALGQAVTPVIDLLKKSEGEVKAGNMTQAIASMGGFLALWNTASPVIKPLVGD